MTQNNAYLKSLSKTWQWGALLLLVLGITVALLSWLFMYPDNISKKALTTTKSLSFVYLGVANTNYMAYNNARHNDHPFLKLDQQLDIALALSFAKSLDLKANLLRLPTIADINTYLSKNHEAIALGIPALEGDKTITINPYRESTLLLVSPRKKPFPKTLTQAIGIATNDDKNSKYTIALLATTPHRDDITELMKNYPEYQLLPLQSNSIQTLIKSVENHQADYAFVSKTDWALLSHTLPSWISQLSFDKSLELGWRVSNSMSKKRLQEINAFFNKSKENGLLLSLAEEYRHDLGRLDQVDLHYFEVRKRSRLARYQALFEKAAKATNQSPELLMALSYQESQWDETQVSTTGARGLMMINAPTAVFLKLPIEPTAEEQIMAGARYLKLLRNDLHRLPEPDRTLIALASYNLGPGAVSRLLTKMTDQYILANNLKKIEGKRSGKLIRPKIQPAAWEYITWPRLRYYIIQQSALNRVSTQPVILTERVRIFKSLLEGLPLPKINDNG